MICYHKACNNPLPRGLYLGFVKLKTSVDTMSIVVPQHNPNVMPHIKVRDNPHVSREEWTSLRQSQTKSAETKPHSDSAQLRFLQLISKSSNFLLNSMKISKTEISNHRIYDIEVIELSSEVSFVLVLPPVESVCSMFGEADEVWPCSLIYLPLRIFELSECLSFYHFFCLLLYN